MNDKVVVAAMDDYLLVADQRYAQEMLSAMPAPIRRYIQWLEQAHDRSPLHAIDYKQLYRSRRRRILQQVKRWRDAARQWRRHAKRYKDQLDRAIDHTQELKQEVKQLEDCIETYAQHLVTCAWVNSGWEKACSCGLVELFDRVMARHRLPVAEQKEKD